MIQPADPPADDTPDPGLGPQELLLLMHDQELVTDQLIELVAHACQMHLQLQQQLLQQLQQLMDPAQHQVTRADVTLMLQLLCAWDDTLQQQLDHSDQDDMSD